MAVELEIKRGSTFEQVLLCVDEVDDPIDMSLWSFASDLKLQASGETLLSFAVDTTSAASGQISISATPAQTKNLPPQMVLEFDVKFTTDSGDVHYSETIELKTSKHITH